MSVDDAADRMVAGLKRRSFERAFPGRFAFMLKLMNMLPYNRYFALIRRFVARR